MDTSDQDISVIYDRLVALASEGKLDEAREFLVQNLGRLPKELQDDITMRLFMQAVIDEAEEAEALEEIEEEAIETGEALLAASKEIDQKLAGIQADNAAE